MVLDIFFDRVRDIGGAFQKLLFQKFIAVMLGHGKSRDFMDRFLQLCGQQGSVDRL